jgi:thiamine-monophosphate kinase
MPAKELELIQRIRRAAAKGRWKAAIGIGDDCAILDIPRGQQVLVTTDFTLEDIHFRRKWHPADSVGHRCVARGLSDIAAMGGIPRAAFLSLALPSELPQSWVDDFLAGFLKLARRYSVTLAGGDTAQSPAGILADIIVLGEVPSGNAILRSGACAGDIIYVSGTLGVSVATLQELRSAKKLRPSAHLRHFYPDPRIAIGKYLREKKLASAMIDTSDGLSTDLRHICEESGVGAVIEAAALPAVPGDDGLQFALHGGEDYELLFTAPPTKRIPRQIAGTPITRIGEITRGRAIKLQSPDGKSHPLKAGGWQHFA